MFCRHFANVHLPPLSPYVVKTPPSLLGTPREPRQRRQFFQIILNRARRRAPEDDARSMDALAGWDAGLRTEYRTGTDLDVVGDADLAADDGAVADGAAAGDAGLRGDDDIAADGDVVPHMNEVVELGAAADARYFKRAAIDRGVRSDFNIVFDDETALLWELRVLTC